MNVYIKYPLHPTHPTNSRNHGSRAYIVRNLEDTRSFLEARGTDNSSPPAHDRIILTNEPGATKYYGMRVLDYMFTTLKNEFPDYIQYIIVNAEYDYVGFKTASALGYKHIIY